MVSKRKKKYSTGEGSQFISRKQALKKLQLTLNDFRRLCIIKGIYPREPRNRKRAQKGDTGIKTLYHIKDIQFLMHEPIIWTLRDYKIFNRKVGRAKAIRDFKTMKKFLDNHPTLKLDHIVKERYPTFIDAIRDLDDCLTLCFLFSTFPSLVHIPREQFNLCRRLTIEFMHAIIEAKALRKVFISIKGYYYQAEIKGQTVTWIVPHHFSFEPQSRQEVDFKVMSTFVEFYLIMLGFVNYRLYHSLNLFYPPKLSISTPNESEKTLVDENIFVSERISALNTPLVKMSNESVEEDIEIDEFTENNPEKIEEARIEAIKIKKLKTLFKGLRFFLNREVPREPLVFIIRCFGGEVSWDKNLFVGSTFNEDDETITHQIADRPSLEKQFISRYYVQPQWIFDSVNAKELLPVNKYFIGEVLPPHLSPFVNNERNPFEQYIPPEERALIDPAFAEEMNKKRQEKENVNDEDKQVEDINSDDQSEDDDNENNDLEETEVEKSSSSLDKKNKLSVAPGKIYKEEPWMQKKQERQEYKLREKMIKKKHRKIYRAMIRNKKDKAKESWLLRKKRRIIDETKKQVKDTKT